VKLGDVIDNRTFERKLLTLAKEFERRVGLLTEGQLKLARDRGVPALLRVLREHARPMTYREVMEYLPISDSSHSRWAFRSKFTQTQKRGLIRIYDYVEAYNNIWSPRWVLEEVAKGSVGERLAKLKDWFDGEVDLLDGMRLRRSCVAITAFAGSLGWSQERNREVIKLRGMGMTNREIGGRFGISAQRVDQIIQWAIRTSGHRERGRV
jgi:hypothetical protein